VLAQVKNNLAPPQPSLAYRVVAAGAAPTVSWLGPTDDTADALLAAAYGSPPRLGPRDCAKEFLADALRDGPRTSRDLWKEAEPRGLTRRTLHRAMEGLEVSTVRVHEGGRATSYWLLPGQELPAGVKPEDAVPDLEEWLGPLREQCPPPTPLDDL
jgi:hypothetical protein